MYINLFTSGKHLKNLLLFCFLSLSVSLSAQFTISGKITARDGTTPLPGVPVFVTGTTNDATLTDVDGNYNITVPSGGAYSVHPFANAFPLNGVSTLDVVLFQLHAMGQSQQPLTAYDLIAADVDDSGEFSQDTILMFQLITGVIEEFPGDESWRFVRSDYVFPDPTHPFPFPRSFEINNISADHPNIDFIGVKLGDLNSTAIVQTEWLTGTPYFSRITGNVLWDENNNCTQDTLEAPLKDWKVIASGTPGNFVVNTRPDGNYNLRVPEGSYTVTLIKPNNLWSVCTPFQNVMVGEMETVIVPFSAQADKNCPHMEVDLVCSNLRRCFNGLYVVRFSNTGTTTAMNAYIDVELDTLLTYISSSIPFSANTGNTYSFPLGNVVPGQDGYFIISVGVSCEAELGQTHCSTAHIFPDTICGPGAENGARLRVTGNCNGEEVEFTVTNEGESMTEPAGYVIIEDIMIQMVSEQIQLATGESETYTVQANGSTWRMEIEQPENSPLGLHASAAVEGCGTNASGGTSQGYITLFPQDDAAFYIDEECQNNVGSFDPNDKQGFPKGVGSEHFIPKGEEIEYLIRFQNTGTDTAFTVMVMDTISSLLDITTLRAGASSHPYTFNLLGQGVAQFVFSNIMLPDSNVNEAASHGFVKFTISPQVGLPDNTQLENEAAIYFDFNEPVITNRTLHTIGEQYLEVTQVKNLQQNVALLVYPNPARTEATFQLKSARPLAGTLFLYDMQGREVKQLRFDNNTCKVNTSNLPSGHYFFRMDADGKGLSTGKIVVENR